ncbi:biotin transporter BioY [Streptosporangium roseum]|uniref:Biotin transporter n=1 Tax=Streptosporangium roseum (strain ATCC 12428 / DSM 43021 / JCM 3005 / KCTC 9067 / NCIMB 10171 / NRRL 2505 / NI 9100) TaxID=479432 RepID=D2B0N8_STRRD|nr:biotin transporter BioY [Streptosporangium roseum]ACZ91050.1 BioY family protein [Streptosporangium roseum DSM 43021]
MANASPVARPAVLSDLIPGSRVRDLALVAGGAALTGLAAQLTFPMWPVPVTGQTFAVVLVGAALGMNRAALSMALYMLVGVAGVPWFQGGTSGLGGPTIGYVIGFIAAAAIVGRLAERGGDRTVLRTAGTMVLGNLTIYAFGLPVLMAGTGLGLGGALAAGVIPFLAGDALKIAVAAGLLPAAWKLSGR